MKNIYNRGEAAYILFFIFHNSLFITNKRCLFAQFLTAFGACNYCLDDGAAESACF